MTNFTLGFSAIKAPPFGRNTFGTFSKHLDLANPSYMFHFYICFFKVQGAPAEGSRVPGDLAGKVVDLCPPSVVATSGNTLLFLGLATV